MNKNKTFFVAILIMAAAFLASPVKAQVTIGELDKPDVNAVLDLRSKTKLGLLLPRLQLATTTSSSPMSGHVAGMVVYNIAPKGDVVPGLYYNDGTKWVLLGNGAGSVTTFSSNDLSPLFTTSVATPATTPVLSFALSNADAKTIFGNNNTTTGSPSYFPITQLQIAGDVTGTLGNAIVAKIQGRAVATTPPTNGQVLAWNNTNSAWTPADPPASGWLLTGNTATATDFLGTTSNQPLQFKVNNQKAGIIGNSVSNASVALGYQALNANTSPYNNAFGYQALTTNTTGGGNNAFGYLALQNNTTGIRNNAFGYSVLQYNTTGGSNNAFGYSALSSNTTGYYNSAFGESALEANTTGSHNNAFGYLALSKHITGDYNSAFGNYALQNDTTGVNNNALGAYALRYNRSGQNNSVFGYSALQGSAIAGTAGTASYNSAFGNSALMNDSTGNYNSAFGMYALRYVGSGNNNTAVGYNAGNTTSGSNNIAIGANTTLPSATADYQLNIGGILRGINIGTATTATNNPGRIGIGVNNPQSTFEVNGAATNTSSSNAGASVAINFTLSNLSYSASTNTAPAFNCTGLKDGGTYTLAWQGAVQGTATVATNMQYTRIVNNREKTAGQHALYTIVCINTTAYVYVTLFNSSFN